MTDENERMDRARRIREIREGTAEAQATDLTDDASGPTPDDTEETGDGDSATAGAGGGANNTKEPTDAGGTQPGQAQADEAGAGTAEDVPVDIPGGSTTDVSVDVEELAEQAGLDPEEVEQDDEEAAAGAVGMAGAKSARSTTAAAETRVLEFDLGSERYCLDIEHVEEIVKRDTVTRVPNTPDYVEGVVDLRGQITTILDPKVLLDIDGEGEKDLIVVFDPEDFEDQGALGWVVDDVNQVTPVVDEEVNESPVDADHVNGVVERDGEFVVWTDPDIAIETAAG